MAILRKKIYLLVILFVFGVGLPADQSMILIDKSGSMRGFSTTGELEVVYQGIDEALKKSVRFSNVRLFAFDETGLLPYRRFGEISYSKDTLIDLAVNQAFERKPDLIVILTDNIQDPGGADIRSDVTKFYSHLKKHLVEWVFIIPLKLNFDGWTYHDPQWQGERAAIIYVLLLKKSGISHQEKEKRERVFLNTVTNIETAVDSHRIRCKPLETGVNMNFKKIKKVDRNINITPKEVNFSPKRFTSSPSLGVKLVLMSRYANLAVSRAKLEGTAVGRIKIDGLFKDITSNDFDILIQPSEATVPPGVTDDRYQVTISTNKLAYKKDLISLLKMPFSKNGKISGELIVEMIIPKQNLQLRQDILTKYSAADQNDPGRIYGLNQLVPMLAEGKEVKIRKRIKFNIFMPYPGWPGIVFFIIFLILIALPFIALKIFKSSHFRFILKINGSEQGEVKCFPLLWTVLHSLEYGPICKARFRGDRLEVIPMPGCNWGEGEGETLLRSFARGDSFALESDEGENFFVELVPLEKREYKFEQKEVNGEEDSSFFQD